jgi:DNA primase
LAGKDPDECIRKDKNLWIESIKGAVPVYDFLIESAFERHGESAMGKRRIGEELLPIITGISDEIMKAHYVKKLAGRLEVEEEVVIRQMERVKEFKEEKRKEGVLREKVKEKKSRGERLEEYLLGLVLQKGGEEVKKRMKDLGVVETAFYKRVVDELKRYFRKYKKFSSERFGKFLPTELVEGYNRLYLLDFGELEENEERQDEEIKKALAYLRKIKLKDGLKKISLEIKKLEGKEKLSGEERKWLREANKRFDEKLKRLRERER